MNGMFVYQGVVESRADPLESGRCKVRVVGVHTENTELLPTIDLPWAIPMQPITSAATSGIGHSPTGPVEGTWVYVFFADGENRQQPVMMGTIAGIPASKEQEFTDSNKGTSGTDYEGLSDSSGGATGSGGSSSSGNGGSNSGASSSNGGRSGEQVLTQEPTRNQQQTTTDSEYRLGQVSKKYESGNSGPGTVSSGSGDRGGVSYGTHQLASYRDQQGNSKNSDSANSPVQQFVNSSKWKDDFKGLVPGSKEYSDKWRETAKNEPQAFEQAQYEYFKGQYYSRGSNNIKAAGIDLSNRGPAVQEAIWSTSIQHGPGGARKVFVRALDGKDIGKMSDAEIVAAVQDDKLKNVDNDFKSSSDAVKNGVRNRIKNEKNDLVRLAGDERGSGSESNNGANGGSSGSSTKKPMDYTEDSKYVPPSNPTPTSGVNVPTTPTSNSKPGFQDPKGNYPREKWLNESDVSRLARNKKIQETIMEAKRNSLVKGVQSTTNVQWDEPESQYGAIYPLNHVYQSESGHTQEFDDTPNKERIHIYHRQGSFIEWHPDGTVVYKSVKDEFEVTVADRNVYVGGTCNITVEGDTNIFTKGVMRMESDGDMFIKTKSNMRIGAEGTLHMESNGEMFIGSKSNLNEAGSNIFMNCYYSAETVNAGGFDTGTIAVEVMHDSLVPVPEKLESEVIEELKREGKIGSGGNTSGGGSNTGTPTEPSNPTTEAGGAGKSEDPPKKDDDKPKCEGCCDFTEADIKPSLQLSQNYTLADLTTSAYYPHALREQGGKSKLEIAKNLCTIANEVLEKLAAYYGKNSFRITSGFRGGSGTSQHLRGEAVDIQFSGLSHDKAAQLAQDISEKIAFDQMILEWHGNAPVFHISHGGAMRGQRLTTPDLKSYFTGFRHKDMKPLK